MHLALCHTVVIDKKKGTFNSSSPDEIALLEGARDQGYVFMGKKEDNNMVIKCPTGQEKRYKLLNVLEFNSTRKRMSIVVRDLQTQELVLLSKGADSIMLELMDKSNQKNKNTLSRTQAYVDMYAIEGLRTLILAKRVLDEQTYSKWNLEYEEAANSVIDRDIKLDIVNAKLEHELEVVGSTAIEDRLQEEVPETIIALKQIGVKVWVLTGDKVETAINIGYSAGLLNNEME